MALLFMDGFDKYGPINSVSANVATMLTAGEWNSSSGAGTTIVAGLSAIGLAVNFVVGSALSKTLAANYSRLIGGSRFSPVTLSATNGIVFTDTITNQCSVTINTTGTISIRTGGLTGAIIATSAASVTAGTTHELTWDITFGAAGAYQVWLDNVSVLSGTGATKVSANSYANVLAIGGNSITWDDFYLFDTTGATNNAALLTSPRIETQTTTGDSAVQFSFGAAILGQAVQTVSSTNAPGANQIFLRKFTPTLNCTLASVSIVPSATSVGAKFKAVAYSDSAGAANTLLSSGTEVVGTTTNIALVGPLVTPQALTTGTSYWIGFITDTSVTLQENDATTVGYKAANTYASGAPSPAPAMTSGQPSWIIYGNLTGVAVNWYEVAISPPPGDISYVFDATVGHEDLYNFPALITVPASIYAVAVKGNMKRTDVGARTVSLRMKSGGTDSGGTATGQTPGTSYTWLTSNFETDPNTAAAWVPANLNSATSGVKVDS